MEITLNQLKRLCEQQKRNTIEKLRGTTYLYNKESTPSQAKSLPIDENIFLEVGLQSNYPDDILILEKYGVK